MPACGTSCSSRSRRRNDSYSTATLESFCGVSGTNPDTVCNLFQPGVMPGSRPTFVSVRRGHAGVRDRLQQLRAERRRRVDVEGFVRRDRRALRTQRGRLGPSRRLHARVQPRGHGAVLGSRSARTRASRSMRRGTQASETCSRAAAARAVPGSASRLTAPAVLVRVSVRRTSVTQDVNLMDPNLQVPYADSWTVGLQRTVGRNMAVEVALRRHPVARHLGRC